jgi:hypothetical protein
MMVSTCCLQGRDSPALRSGRARVPMGQLDRSMMRISIEMASLIREVFPAVEVEPILGALSSLEEDDSPDPNQVIGAILILLKNHGHAELDAIVRLAARDWRDLLMGAGLADDDWAFQLRRAIASWGGDPDFI